MPNSIIAEIYDKSKENVGSGDMIISNLPSEQQNLLDMILIKSESSKAVLTVFITSCVYKICHPAQDIRKHQTSIKGGYSGRTFDTKYITPFMKKVKFPSMAESGWLTRSLEQKVPYGRDYPGAIRPAELKNAFLEAIEIVNKGERLEEILSYIFQGLIVKRNFQRISLARPVSLGISSIVSLLNQHFHASYTSNGASRLPVLAIYAAYECLMGEAKRFKDKTLLDLESHTSADSQSGRVGDIDIIDDMNEVYESVEIKHGLVITNQLIKDAFEKFKVTQVKRYYLLSTASNLSSGELNVLDSEIERIKKIHGCHVIVNGVTDTLKYYLRLLVETSEFVKKYVTLVENDKSLKFEHKKEWNMIIGRM